MGALYAAESRDYLACALPRYTRPGAIFACTAQSWNPMPSVIPRIASPPPSGRCFSASTSAGRISSWAWSMIGAGRSRKTKIADAGGAGSAGGRAAGAGRGGRNAGRHRPEDRRSGGRRPVRTPGTMDIPRGMFLQPHNLPHWHYFPIRDCVAEAFGLPTAFANDANAAAYGEFWVGSGQKYHSIVMLTLGTGVGGGIIIGDLSVDGENSHGSECGHIIIDSSPTARMCGCGQPGHLEAYCSATALVKRTQELLANGRASSLTQRITRRNAAHRPDDRRGSRQRRFAVVRGDHGAGHLAGPRLRQPDAHDRSRRGDPRRGDEFRRPRRPRRPPISSSTSAASSASTPSRFSPSGRRSTSPCSAATPASSAPPESPGWNSIAAGSPSRMQTLPTGLAWRG